MRKSKKIFKVTITARGDHVNIAHAGCKWNLLTHLIEWVQFAWVITARTLAKWISHKMWWITRGETDRQKREREGRSQCVQRGWGRGTACCMLRVSLCPQPSDSRTAPQGILQIVVSLAHAHAHTHSRTLWPTLAFEQIVNWIVLHNWNIKCLQNAIDKYMSNNNNCDKAAICT